MIDRREKYKENLHPEYLKVYEKLCSFLDEKWQPYSGYRSFDEQAFLYSKGRSRDGNIVTYSRAGESAHNYGCASDWTIFVTGAPVWPKAVDPLWNEYSLACDRAGAMWGGNFRGIKDCFHNELFITHSWAEVAEIYRDINKQAALDFIAKNMRPFSYS